MTTGATTATFTASANTISTDQTATLTAAIGGANQQTTIFLLAPNKVTSLACQNSSVGLNGSTSCTVSVRRVADTNGNSVTISDNSSRLSTPSSVMVAAGATTAAFTLNAGTFSNQITVTVTASLNSSSATAQVTLMVVKVSSLQCTPASLSPNSSATCTVTLNTGALAGSTSVSVSSSGASALSVRRQ